MESFLDREHLGPDGSPAFVLVVPHADGGQRLLAEHPEILEACAAPEALLRRYLLLEADHGSIDLARSVARHLEAQDLGVDILTSRLPRGLIDAGRLPARALRHVWRADADSRLLALLVESHAEGVRQVVQAVRGLDPREGIFVDLHTMASRGPRRMRSPTESADERPEALDAYIALFVEGGARREAIDLITHIGADLVADLRLREEIATALDVARRRWVANRPYAAADHLVAGMLMRERRGIMLDVPKHWLFGRTWPDPADPPPADGINALAMPIAEALLRARRAST